MNKLDDLKIWIKSIELCEDMYRITKDFPSSEMYGMVSQMRRSALSICSNIAEGAGRSSKKEFIHFLSIAHGSSYELETQLIISHKLGYISEQVYLQTFSKIKEIQKMNYSFKMALGNSSVSEPEVYYETRFNNTID